ncbi:MAG: TonB-dependent receptor domain-containing protein [Pyrinomonadaceae bacterium]
MYESFMRRFGKSLSGVFAVLCVLVAASSVFAQLTTGNLQGVVRDPNKAVVAGASVKVTNTETGVVRETTTNQDGLYRVVNLLPGALYRVEVAAPGFAARTVENVAVRLATENSADIELGVQGAAGEVTVTSETPLLSTTQDQLSTEYSQRQITQLPFNGGSIDNLALLTPGVATPGDADFTNGVGISANGNRGRSNNFQLDGQDNNDNSVAGPSLSITNTQAICDYQVTTNNPSAEFGRNAGAQINAVTCPGTNNFHGSLFEYLNTNRLDSRNNIEKQNAAAFNFLANNGFDKQFRGIANRNGQDPFTLNRFGGSIGGPIKKNRAFFFVTFQADVQNGEASTNNLGSGGLTFTPQAVQIAKSLGFPGAISILGNTNVGGGPSAANVSGQFYVVPTTQDTNGDGVIDAFVNPGGAFTNSIFVCNVNPGFTGTTPNPCPAANLVALQTGEAVRISPFLNREYQLITKEDFTLTNKDTLNVRYIYDTTKFPNSPATGRFLAGAFFDVPSKNNNLGVTYTRLISSTYTNEARFNFSRLDVKFGDPAGTLPGPGISFSGQRDVAGNFNSLTFGTANNLPQSRKVDVYQEQDTLSATLGNHFVKAGIDLRQQRVQNFFLPNFLGVFRFRGGSGGGTVASGASLCPNCRFFNDDGTARGGNALAFENLLLARPDRINFALGNPSITTSQNDYFFFVQDDYRVREGLTLNLGLRYEYSSTPFNPIIDQLNKRESDPATAIFDTRFPIENRTVPKLKTDKNNFAPRVGFAYSPNLKFFGDRFSNGRTVIRAGFGIAYDPSFFNIVLNTVTAAPFAASGLVTQVPGTAGALPFPSLPTTVAQLNTTPGTNGGDPRLFNQTRVDPNFYSPYTMGFNVGIQQQIFKDSVVEVRYVGSRIIGQFQTVNGNPDVRFLNRAAQCLGLNPGAFSAGNAVGTPAASADAACNNSGFNSRSGTNGNGRLDPNFGPVRVRNNGARSTYDGLQIRFDTRFSNVVFNANYTFSKTIDNASEIFGTLGGGQSIAVSQNPFDTSNGERGLSAFHQKHNFTANFNYELPFYRTQKGFVGKALGGFQVSGILLLGSGRPYTPVEAFANVDPGFEGSFTNGVLRPFNGNRSAPNGTIAFGYGAACLALFGGPECDYNGGAAGPGSFIVFNTLKPGSIGTVVASAQAAQQAARLIYNDAGLVAIGFLGSFNDAEAFKSFRNFYGDVGRNTFFGDKSYRVNLNIIKVTNISERLRLEFRAEATNIFNRRNFGVPDAITEDASFGNFVGSFQNPGFNSGSARSVRFGVRFLF